MKKLLMLSLFAAICDSSIFAQQKPKTDESAALKKIIFDQNKVIADLTIRVSELEKNIQKLQVAQQDAFVRTVYVKCADGTREIHSAPNYVSDTIARISCCGTPLAASNESNGYFRVRTPDGILGFIMEDFVSQTTQVSTSDLADVKSKLERFDCTAELNHSVALALAMNRPPLEYEGAGAMDCTQQLGKLVNEAIEAIQKGASK